MTNINNLFQLQLNDNDLSGTIPSEFGPTSMSGLFLHNNRLTGKIPATLSKMVFVGTINLYNNSLSGTIPSELCQLGAIRNLILAENRLLLLILLINL